jgi:hypothetical protein
MHTGALLHVTAPLDGPDEPGFKAYVRLESVDLPTHNPGDPLKATYSIRLSADYIIGPTSELGSVTKDEDDWPEKDKWLISEASETWDIQESDQFSYDRNLIYGKIMPGQSEDSSSDGYRDNIGKMVQQKKLYTLTRNISAKGKNKFDRNEKPDGLKADGFTPKYDVNGRAWQQARGFVYDIVKYGNRFIFGVNDEEYTSNIPSGGNKTHVPDAKGTGSELTYDADDYHLFGIGLPTPNNITGGYSGLNTNDAYKGFNYKRIQNVDPRNGTFSVVETWLLAPRDARAVETVDIQLSEDADGTINVTFNGVIQGLADNADDYVTEDDPLGAVGNENNSDRKIRRRDAVPNQITENFHYTGEGGGTCSVEGGYDNKDSCEAAEGVWTPSADGSIGTVRTTNSKWENAIFHYTQIAPHIANAAKGIINDLPEYKDSNINPTPTSKTIGEQIGTGTITYSYSFRVTPENLIPFVRAETVNVNDTYPGHVVAQHTVLGRRIGPVMQSIGTQTLWQRDLTIALRTNIEDENICVDNKNQLLAVRNQTQCLQGWQNGVQNRWIKNPNYVDLRGWLPIGGIQAGYKITQAKPGGQSVIREGVDEAPISTIGSLENSMHIQNTAIYNLIRAFDPSSYYTFLGSDDIYRVRKRFLNPPQESWNPKTGEWSYSLSWIYEIIDPWAFPSTDYIAPVEEVTDDRKQNDYLDQPDPGQLM